MNMKRPSTFQGTPLEKKGIYETLLTFIDDVLFQYKILIHETGEDKITQDLVMSLNDEAHRNDAFFAFMNQYEEGKYTTDIGVYLTNNRYYFSWIEAKRLPIEKKKDRDEREYVFVDKKYFSGGGGIQRFKESKHAPKLNISIMFGYIQDENTVDYWYTKINSWIIELADSDNGFWNSEDCLEKYDSNKCDRFISLHKRKDKEPITLHHYWIKL